MLKSNDIYRINAQLFSTAVDDISFEQALKTIIDKFDGVGGAIFELNRQTGAISNWIGPGLEDGENDYINHLNAINPRMHYSLCHTAGHIVYEGLFIDDRSMDRHEFYDAIDHISGVRYFLGARIYDEGDTSLFHSIEFTTGHGHPENGKIDDFKRIMPALGNAWRLAKRTCASNSQNGSSPWTPDHLPWSIFALSSSGTIVEMNNSARKMLERRDVLFVHDGILTPLDTASSAKFTKAVQQGISGKTSETLLSAGDAKAPLIAQIIPANPAKITAPQPISILIYISNPMEHGREFGNILTRLFGFTPAETRLASILKTGVGLNLAAEQLGISRNTARNQQQKMFAKTDSHSQSEFLVRILGILEN